MYTIQFYETSQQEEEKKPYYEGVISWSEVCGYRLAAKCVPKNVWYADRHFAVAVAALLREQKKQMHLVIVERDGEQTAWRKIDLLHFGIDKSLIFF